MRLNAEKLRNIFDVLGTSIYTLAVLLFSSIDETIISVCLQVLAIILMFAYQHWIVKIIVRKMVLHGKGNVKRERHENKEIFISTIIPSLKDIHEINTGGTAIEKQSEFEKYQYFANWFTASKFITRQFLNEVKFDTTQVSKYEYSYRYDVVYSYEVKVCMRELCKGYQKNLNSDKCIKILLPACNSEEIKTISKECHTMYTSMKTALDED